MKHILSTILFVCTISTVFAQSYSQIKADKHYEQLSYAKAEPYYLAAYKADSSNVYLLRRLASCLFHMNAPEQAEVYYSKLVKNDDVKPQEIYNYVWALKSNKKYELANEYMKKFHALQASDARANHHADLHHTLDDLVENDGSFTIFEVSTNTNQADFSAAYIGKDSNKQVAFVSARASSKAVSRTHSWNHSPYLNLYQASINESADFIDVKELSDVANTRYHEGPLTYNKELTRVYFTRNNYYEKKRKSDEKGVTKLKIYFADIDAQGNWSKEQEFKYNSDDYSVGHPTLSKDGQTLYFASDMPGGQGGTDIWKSTLENNSWSTPENLGAHINSEGNELFPFISDSDKLFFSSNGWFGIGGLDLFYARKTANGFSKPKNMGGSINSSKDDFGIIVNSLENAGYFSSNRSGGSGDDDIYGFKGEISPTIMLSGVIKDASTNELLQGATVRLLDQNKTVLQEIKVNQSASYEFEVLPSEQYFLSGEKQDYTPVELSQTIPPDATQDITKDLNIEKEALKLVGTVVSKDYKTPIQNARVKVVDNNTGKVLHEFSTKDDGSFSDLLKAKEGDQLNYLVSVSADGYLSKSDILTKKIDQEKIVDITKELDLALNKIEVGADIGKIININPIYFDLNKSNIRSDAAIELDKIVKVMNENPSMVIELGSHTDCRASRAYNRSLSDRRAKSSAKYIQGKIDKASRIYGKGYGESQLVNKCECEGSRKVPCSEEEHQLNRRTEFKIVKM